MYAQLIPGAQLGQPRPIFPKRAFPNKFQSPIPNTQSEQARAVERALEWQAWLLGPRP